MTHDYFVEEHGTRDYRDGIPLSGNPYNPALSVDAYEAWRTGWLEASRARGRYLQTLVADREPRRHAVGV